MFTRVVKCNSRDVSARASMSRAKYFRDQRGMFRSTEHLDDLLHGRKMLVARKCQEANDEGKDADELRKIVLGQTHFDGGSRIATDRLDPVILANDQVAKFVAIG